MRLKVFFAPMVFLVVVIVSIWLIWPAVGDIMLKMKELKASKNNLNSASEKKSSLENMIATLDKNKEKEDFILNFLPQNKSEEKIVDGINYLAADSGLSLINVSLHEEKEMYPGPGSSLAASSLTESVPSAVSSDGSAIPPQQLAKIKNITAKAVLSGKYENIKMFIEQIYRMQMSNAINSLTITKQESGVGSSESPTDVLMATIEIDFGYMQPIHSQLSENLPDSNIGNLDFSLYSKLKDSISEKIPSLDGGEKGKSNPFIP